jgi:hypothetical protein
MKRIGCMLLVFAALGLCGARAGAQSSDVDAQPPLGDVARAYRKDKKAPLPVITNDNFSRLPQLIRETEQQALAAGLIAPPQQTPKQPEVTCSFAFNAQAKPVAPAGTTNAKQDLPASEVSKLEGPAVIADGSLQVSIYNGTTWEVQEITVGLTIVRRDNAVLSSVGRPRFLPASTAAGPVPMLKKADVTVLYHLNGSAPPFTTAAFNQRLGISPGPGDEWHWAILQARGVPPSTPAK